ncbi:MAG: hypothetical protein ISS82_05290, partial [Nanoarchaeota archaeon]|nr:hypothetical protein [Nanoarchaeota archaeon]
SSNERYENTSLSTFNYTLGTNKPIIFSCYKLYYENRTSNKTITIQDTTKPVLNVYALNKTPEPSYNSDNVTLNVSISDLLLQEVWLEGNWTGDWVNYTNSSGVFTIISGDEYNYNISSGNFTNQELISYKWCSNDTTNNINCSSYYEFRVENRAPSVPVLQYPLAVVQLYDNATIFDWDNSTDADQDNITYNFQLSNQSSFSSFIKNLNFSQSNYTLPLSEMPDVGDYFWRVRSYDNISYSSFNDSNVSIVYATISIISPTYDQIFRTQNSYNFNVSESSNGDWVNNISMKLSGSTFTSYHNFTANGAQYEFTSYNYTYAVPSVNSQYVTITAYGWNGSIGSSSNVSKTGRFRITIPSVVTATQPTITYFCPEKTYITNQNINITVRTTATLGVLIDSVNVTCTLPNGTIDTLAQTGSNEEDYAGNNYAYEYNFTYTPKTEGEHTLKVEIKDINYGDTGIIANTTSPLYVRNATNITFTSSGISNFTVKDICSMEVIKYTNSSLSMEEPPGEYNLEFSVGKITVLVSNVSLDGDEGDICVFNDLAEDITPPTDTRAVDQFNLSCYALEFGWGNPSSADVNITYNYTGVLGSITHEENLKMYRCDSVASCTWSGTLAATLSTDLNKIEVGLGNFSVYMLAEDTTITTVTVTTTVAGGGGGGGGASGGKKPVALNIIQPGSLSLYGEDTIYTPIIIENTGSIQLRAIKLSATTPSESLVLSLSNDYIDSLNVGEQATTTLTITSLGAEPGEYEIKVIADVASPKFIDSVKMFINLLEGDSEKAQNVAQQLRFLQDLFNGNPECLELKELLTQAEGAYELDQYDKSMSLIDAAIQSCKDLLSLEGKEMYIPKKPRKIPDIVVLIGEIMLFLFIFMLIYRYYKRRRFKKK